MWVGFWKIQYNNFVLSIKYNFCKYYQHFQNNYILYKYCVPD